MSLTAAATLVIGSALIRDGLARILSDSGFKVAQATAEPGDIDIDRLDRDHVVIVEDTLLLDDRAELDTLLVQHFARCRLVVLAEKFDIGLMKRTFAAGAHGCILKDISYQSFVAMIQLVSLGEKVAPTRLIEELPKVAAAEGGNGALGDDHLKVLTGRERSILDLLVLGLPNKTISRELGISEASVKVAVKAIFRKLAVKNRTQAALFAKASSQ